MEDPALPGFRTHMSILPLEIRFEILQLIFVRTRLAQKDSHNAPRTSPKEVLPDMALILSKSVSIRRHDDVTNSDDEEEPYSDNYISASEKRDEDGEEEEEEEEESAASTSPTPGAGGSSVNSADERNHENDFGHGPEEDVRVYDGYEYFLRDVPKLPRYQCQRSWRNYHVPEGEDRSRRLP